MKFKDTMKRRWITAVLSLGLVLSSRVAGYAQSQDLVEAAKKEGEVVLFGSLESDTTNTIIKAFEEKFGLKAKYFRGSSPVIIDRTVTEHRTGKMTSDVVFTTSEPMKFINAEKGLFARYVSPSGSYYDKRLIDEFFGPNYRSLIVGAVYNKNLIKPEEAPRSYEDLVNSKWKGKLAMGNPTLHDVTINWLSSLHLVLGSSKKAEDWIKRLAAQEPLMVDSMLPVGERIASGEVPLGITYVKYVFVYGKKGAPLDYVKGFPGYLGDGNFIGLVGKAPHPNTARLFIDFFLGQESMEIMAKEGEFVNKKGVYPPISGAEEVAKRFVQMISMTADDYARKKEEYRRIFRR